MLLSRSGLPMHTFSFELDFRWICFVFVQQCLCSKLCLGFIPTDAWDRNAFGGQEVLDAIMAAQTPMKRWGSPDEIGHMVAFLCSDKAAYVTGATIPVDGGVSLQLHKA